MPSVLNICHTRAGELNKQAGASNLRDEDQVCKTTTLGIQSVRRTLGRRTWLASEQLSTIVNLHLLTSFLVVSTM